MPSAWLPAATLCLMGLAPAAILGAQPQDPARAAAVFPPWWSQARILSAAARAGDVAGVGALSSIVITAAPPGREPGLPAALRREGAWLVIDPGFAGPCQPPSSQTTS